MKRVSLIGRPPEGWPAEVGASPPKPLSRPGATLTWLKNAGIRPANSHVGMPVCDGRWSVASRTPRLKSWEKSVADEIRRAGSLGG